MTVFLNPLMIQEGKYFSYHGPESSNNAGFASCPECKSRYNIVPDQDPLSIEQYPDVLFLEPEYPHKTHAELDLSQPPKGKRKKAKQEPQPANPEYANGLRLDRVINFCGQNYIHLCSTMWMPNPPHFWTVLTYNDRTYVYGVPPVSPNGNAVYLSSDAFVCTAAVEGYATQPVRHYYARAELVSTEFLPSALLPVDGAPGSTKSEEEGKEKEEDGGVETYPTGSKRGCSSPVESPAKKQRKDGE